MNEEHSESGAPIYRYEPRDTSWTPPNMEDSCVEAISSHIEKHVGPIATVWHELVSDVVHIDVHQVAPTDERPFWTLITSGMSDLAMTTPAEYEAWAFAELMICLPKEWKMDETDFKDEKYYWPVRWLKILARFPHEYQTWLSAGHSIPNGNPPNVIHETVLFDCMMLSRPKTVSTEFWTLPVHEKKKIQFFSVMPLYPGETILKLKKGSEELESRFERYKISEIVDPKRRDVSRRDWWQLW
jgi:hypothetical protein